MKEQAPSREECDHEGPVIIEPDEGYREGEYRASCLICLAHGSPQDTHEEALSALFECVWEQR